MRGKSGRGTVSVLLLHRHFFNSSVSINRLTVKHMILEAAPASCSSLRDVSSVTHKHAQRTYAQLDWAFLGSRWETRMSCAPQTVHDVNGSSTVGCFFIPLRINVGSHCSEWHRTEWHRAKDTYFPPTWGFYCAKMMLGLCASTDIKKKKKKNFDFVMTERFGCLAACCCHCSSCQ